MKSEGGSPMAMKEHCTARRCRSRSQRPLQRGCPREEIARRLRIEFPDDETMHVSHETIYQSLFVQGRGELRRELSRCLRCTALPACSTTSTRRRRKLEIPTERPCSSRSRWCTVVAVLVLSI